MITYRQPFQGDYPISQGYGVVIPGVTYKDRPHTGIDYACPEGTPILASADGVVQYSAFDTTGYGKVVIIQHKDGTATLYAHLSSRNVMPGQEVKQGDVIGYSGNTGNSTGPHLHFEARRKWNDWRSHFDPIELPLMSVDDSLTSRKEDPFNLKGADSFVKDDLLKVQNPLGVKAFFSKSFGEYTVYQQNAKFYYTGESIVRKDNNLTYLRVIPAQFSVWVAVNDGETQLLDKAE